MLESNNKYTTMQKAYYDNEGRTGNMNRENHGGHNNNPNYWNILISDTENNKFIDKVGLDFGCGCGRNVINLINRFKRMDGVDISPELIKTCISNLVNLGHDNSKFSFYTCDGVSLKNIDDNKYDFVMSTIVLQHICVYTIRFNYFKEFFRIMKSGGLLSFQMGYGDGHYNTVPYHEDFYDAISTNSGCDVKVSDQSEIEFDLRQIGFENITFTITDSHDDFHKQWIFVKAYKP